MAKLAHNPVTVAYKGRNLDMLPVMRQELKNIGSASAQATLFLALLGIAVGVLVTSLASLTTAEIKNPYTWGGFIAALIVSAFATICFGILGWQAWGKYSDQIKIIEAECAAGERD